jgi:hypothetical protein
VTYGDLAIDTIAEWSISPQANVTIGEADSGQTDDRSQFFLLTGVRKLSTNRFVVATDASKQIFVFDELGNAVASFGRQGSGPGEYGHVDLIGSGDRSTAVVFDAMNRRITKLSLDSSHLSLIDLRSGDEANVNPEYLFSDRTLLGRIPSALPDDAPANGSFRDTERVVIVDSALRLQADLGRHAGSDVVVRQAGETFGFALDAPYSRRLITHANDSTILLASTGPFVIGVYSVDGTMRRSIRVSGLRRPVTKQIRQAYRAELLASAANDAVRKAWELRSADEVFLDSLPAFDQMLFDRGGDIWVRLSATAAEKQATWLVLTTRGELVARLQAPSAFTFHDILDDSILGIWTDEWSREQVREYALKRQRK